MSICKRCQSYIPSKCIYNGKEISLANRTYCISCSPINERRIWGGKESSRIMLNGKREKRALVVKERICPVCSKVHKVKTNNLECSACRTNKTRRENKKRAVDILGGSCKICGYNKCIRALVFHHLDVNEKEINLSSNWGNNWDKIESELKKCILLCNRCHEEVHNNLITL